MFHDFNDDRTQNMARCGIVGALFVFIAMPVLAEERPCDLAALQALAPEDTEIVSAVRVTDPTVYCEVKGYVISSNPGPNEINFELVLPDKWAGRFYFGGNGGAAGMIQDPPAQYVQRGFAATATDTGHQGESPIDFSDLYNQPAKKLDYGNRSTHLVAVATQQITRGYYKSTRMTRYFRGCSKGGQQGLTQAQEYPNDFDGIIAGAAGSGIVFPSLVQAGQRVGANVANWLSPAKLQLIDGAVVAQCDRNDGIADGIVNPQLCAFDPAVLACATGQDPSGCLTSAELGTAQMMLAPARTTSGRVIYPKFTFTDTHLGWPTQLGYHPANAPGTATPWLPPAMPPLGILVSNPSAQSMFYDDLNYNVITDFNLSDATVTELETLVRTKSGSMAENPDLSSFANNGARLLMWHGFSDPLVSPYNSTGYYDRVIEKSGGLARTRHFARLFMAPGVLHCADGPGPQDVGDRALDAMIQWVEQGVAPNELIGTRADASSGAVRQFKLCQYPDVPVYKGRGDESLARSYVCQRESVSGLPGRR